MALTEFNGKVGITLTPFSTHPAPFVTGSNVINALGESACFIGKVYLSSGPGTSKTISSAGGKIWFLIGASVTFATAGSTIRAGIQDVAATGLEDGTYDVFDDLVQGTDTFPVSTFKEIIMSSGTKTIAHGDLIAVIIEFTVRNGADSLTILAQSTIMNFPYSTFDTGAGPAKAVSAPFCAIQFDDGTIGHFGDFTLPVTESTVNINSGSTPDEYATIFQLPFACSINGLLLKIGSIAAGDNATVHLIQDPLSAITNLQTITLDPLIQGNSVANGGYTMVDIPETNILANTDYAVSYRPTAVGARLLKMLTLINSNFRTALPILASGATRTDLGAFTQSMTVMPDFGVRINKIDVSSGSSERSVAYIG